MLWRFSIIITDFIGTWRYNRMTGYWSETIFITSLKKNIVFSKSFETSFGSNILASIAEFQCQGTATFGFIQVQTFEIYI